MSMSTVTRQDSAVPSSFAFLRELFVGYGPRDFTVRAWDGSVLEPDAGQPTRFTLVLQHSGAVRKMFWPPSKYTLAEAYIYDDIDIEGDILAFFKLIGYLHGLRSGSLLRRLRWLAPLFALPGGERPRTGRQAAQLQGAVHSRQRDRQAISYHYDVSNDFYQLWLDSRMLYTCAYYADANDDLDRAQERKLDIVCRKLRLRPGERLLDIGCGWGGLAIHAAQQYGAHVLGVTLSRQQAEFAQERIRQAGLQDRCRVEFQDYREVTGTFDKLASICVVEHFGEKLMPEFFGRAYRLLKPGGVFLNQGIVLAGWEREPRGQAFSQRYVFPDGELKPIHVTLRAAEQAGLEVRDVEGLREHYALTTHSWLRRLEARGDEAKRLTDEATYRIWRLYLAGSTDGFQAARANLYQTLLVKPDRGVSGLPLTRADWYT